MNIERLMQQRRVYRCDLNKLHRLGDNSRARLCMVDTRSAFYHARKLLAVYIYPILAGGFIFADWDHTRRWKRGEKVSVLDEILGEDRTWGKPPTQQQSA